MMTKESSAAVRIRRWLTHSWPGRLLIAGLALRVLTFGIRLQGNVALVALDTLGTVCLAGAGLGVFIQLVREARRQRLLWYVRRKLIASYIFLGFVPVALIWSFFGLGGLLLFVNMSAYLIEGRVQVLVNEGRFLAMATALELDGARTLTEADDILTRRQAVEAVRHPHVSMAVVPVDRTCGPGRTARPLVMPSMRKGPWAHMPPPGVPSWVTCDGAASLVAYSTSESATAGPLQPLELVVRAVGFPDEVEPGFAVVADIPVTALLTRQLAQETGVTIGAILPIITAGALRPSARGLQVTEAPTQEVKVRPARGWMNRQHSWFAFLDMVEWDTGETGHVRVTIGMTPADMIGRISATPVRIGNYSVNQILFALLAVVGGLFVVIEGIAFLMGLRLARSITGSVHELGVGTERIRQQDFGYKIPIRTQDQLGDLAQSFNEMSTSIEGLLDDKVVKDRLEEELLVARRIQRSLLPKGNIDIPGLEIVGVCEPAHQVGGDYYDVLPLGPGRVGVLVADVAGKGASAALYMAELKGLMLGLAPRFTSPRDLLIEVNQILARHLDGRSFITITYGVVDLAARTFTYARAGHCPLMHVSGLGVQGSSARILAPDGMMLGLDLPDLSMFSRLLQEDVLPLGEGDVLLLFTDGVTEAMNSRLEWFGEAQLMAALEASREFDLESLSAGILRRLRAFVGEAEAHDDLTMVLLRLSTPVAAPCGEEGIEASQV